MMLKILIIFSVLIAGGSLALDPCLVSVDYPYLANLQSGFWTGFDKTIINAAVFNYTFSQFSDAAYSNVIPYTDPNINFQIPAAGLNITGQETLVATMWASYTQGLLAERHVSNMFEWACSDPNTYTTISSDISLSKTINGMFDVVGHKTMVIKREKFGKPFKIAQIILSIQASVPLGPGVPYGPQP